MKLIDLKSSINNGYRRWLIAGLLLFIPASFQFIAGQELDAQIRKNDEKAISYLSEGKQNAAAQLYNQSAYLLRSANRLNEAAEYYQKVLEINISLEYRRGQMIAYNSLALLYLESENYPKAIYHLEKELEFRKQINNKADIISVMINLALAESETRAYESAIDNIEMAISLSKELNDFVLLKQCYGVAYDTYEKQGNDTKSRAYFELYSAIDKKLKEEKMNEITSEADRKVNAAETEKQLTQQQLNQTSEELEKTASTLQKVEKLTREQQLELDLSKAENAAKDAIIENERLKQRYLKIGIIALTLFVIVLGIMILQILKAKKKINQQKLWLEKQNKEIRASIRYAQTIQQAMLPANNQIEKYFDPFILYLPKDIVSGDFYWITTRESLSASGDSILSVYFAVVDCTGHGVPGAFMSMIGNRLLNEIVMERKIESPAEILGILNHSIREALRQEETDNNDGMDLALCRFDFTSAGKINLVFAGAKRPVYIIKNSENRLITHNGDRKSIGGYSLSKREILFTDYEQKLKKGDMIYLFSDGIIDQNGPDRKKFGRVRLEESMIDCAKLRPAEQFAVIDQRLREYMNNEDQRDDITLIGLKII
jgi:serine phosphatase RsbU (regulator of sigma subunit)